MNEVLHDNPTGDPSDWHRPEALTEGLGVPVRTVRAMAQRGASFERRRIPGGRVYCRQPEPIGCQEQPEAADPEVGALAERFQVHLVELHREHAATVAHLQEQITLR